MYNGSLNSDVRAFLEPHRSSLQNADYCNSLVDTLVQWLAARMDWQKHIIFKGTRMDLDDDALAIIARYYVMLERSEQTLQLLKEQDLPPLVDIDSFFENKEECEELIELKELQSYGFSEDDFYKESNTSFDLMYNYLLSRHELTETLESLEVDVGFPDFSNYESLVKNYVHATKELINDGKIKVEQRAEALRMRLRYDALQRKIESLE